MKNKIKVILKYVYITLFLIGIYILMMLITSLIPSSEIKENVKKSSETLYQEGEKRTIDLKYKKENLFTFTDALMINTAYSVDNTNPESCMLARKNYIPEQTKKVYKDSQYNIGTNEKYKNNKTGDLYQTKELYGLMHGDNIEYSYEYARYWHGYLVILRPLLLLFDYSGIRIFLFLLTLITVMWLLYLICKKINLNTSIMFAVALLSINIFIVSQSINEIMVFLVSFISSIFLLIKKDKIKNIGIFFFVVGSITSFVDLLTAPLVTLGIPLIIYFLLEQKEKINVKKELIDLVKLSIVWGLGYGITWAIKWGLVELIFKRPLISQAIEQILFRINGGHSGIRKFTIYEVVKTNLNRLSKFIIFSILMIAFINIIIRLIKISVKKEKIDIKQNLKKCIPYAIISAFPIIWYAVIKEHSCIHSFFAYRIMVISIINLLVVTNKISEPKEIEEEGKFNKKITRKKKE